MFFNKNQLVEKINQGPRKSWANWVTTSGDRGSYGTNAVRFATKDECDKAGAELASRWFAVVDYISVPSDDEVNYKFENGRSVSI